MRKFVVHRFPTFLFALNYSSNYLHKKLAVVRIAHSYIAINDIYADFLLCLLIVRTGEKIES